MTLFPRTSFDWFAAAPRRCDPCGSPVDEGASFCTTCGTALAGPAALTASGSAADTQPLTAGFTCRSCGATVTCAPGPHTSACVFCGSTEVAEVRGEGLWGQVPEFIVPFRVDREQARESFRAWCRKGFFTPRSVRRAGRLGSIQGIYLPFWRISVRTDSTWEADIGEHWYDESPQTGTDAQGAARTRKPRVRHTEWHPLRGRYHSYHDHFLVSAAQGLPKGVLAVRPFHFEEMRRLRPHDLIGWLVAPASVARAQPATYGSDEKRVRAFLPGDTQAGVEATTTTEISEDLVLLPFWIGTFTSRGRVHRYILNGQTGKGTGIEPGRERTDSVPPLRCGRCREHLDEGDRFCPSCGHEAPGEEQEPADRVPVRLFDCAGCGAALLWELEAQELRCTFCGQTRLQEKGVPRIPAPRLIVPFRIDREQAAALCRTWLERGFFRPGGLRRRAREMEMRGVYLPYWQFSIDCHTYWTADSNQVPPGARAEWAPHFGEHMGRSASPLLPASGVLRPFTHAGDAWDLSQASPWSPGALGGHPAEAFSVPRKRLRRFALLGIKERLRDECKTQVPGSELRRLEINPLYTRAHAAPVLMPAWIAAYEYRGRTYYFVVNGQSGKVAGETPVSPWRVLAAVALAVLALLLLALLAS